MDQNGQQGSATGVAALDDRTRRRMIESGCRLGARAVALLIDGVIVARHGSDADAALVIDAPCDGGIVRVWGDEPRAQLEQIALVLAQHLDAAARAAGEIDSLAGEIVHSYEELHLLYELGEALGEQLSLGAAAGIILESVLHTLPARRADLCLAEPDESHFVRGSDPDLPSLSGAHHSLSSTLRSGGRVVGTLTLSRLLDDQPFASNDGKLLDAVGALAGSAVRNAQLFEELSRHAVELRAREARLRAVLDNVVDGIVAVDEMGTIESFNPSAERVFGYTADEVIGHHFSRLLAGDSIPVGGIAQRLGAEEAIGRRKDGTTFPMDLAVGEMRDSSRRLFILSVRDISERKQAEETLVRTERLRALGQLASGVAHDLNQSLGIIVGFGELAVQALEAPNPSLVDLRTKLNLMVRAARDGSSTADRLLLFGRGQRDGDRAKVDVAAILAEIAEMTAPHWREATQAEGRPIVLKTASEGSAFVMASAASLRELFTNLILNAVDALPIGGRILLACRQRDDRVEIDVSDSGIGMDRDVQARIFEPFYSTKGPRGTGMGLAMVFGIVEQHGGTITVDSAPGAGTTFHLSFPAADPASVGYVEPQPTAGRVATLRILAVDDRPELSDLVAQTLSLDGHEVITAQSGEEALEVMARQPFDVLITDVGLGAGMNGWDLTDEVRKRWPRVGLMLVTGWQKHIDAERVHQHGIGAVVGKPYRPIELLQALETVVATLNRPIAAAV